MKTFIHTLYAISLVDWVRIVGAPSLKNIIIGWRTMLSSFLCFSNFTKCSPTLSALKMSVPPPDFNSLIISSAFLIFSLSAEYAPGNLYF